MEWTITLNDEEQYAEVVTNGIADKDGSLAMVKAISMTMRSTKIKRVLIDHLLISKVSGGIVDIYYRPDELKNIGVTQNIKVAEVIRPEHRDFFSFLETVCVNSGYNFSLFNDKKSALEWLLKA